MNPGENDEKAVPEAVLSLEDRDDILRQHGAKILQQVLTKVASGEVESRDQVPKAIDELVEEQGREGLALVDRGGCKIDSRIPFEPPRRSVG